MPMKFMGRKWLRALDITVVVVTMALLGVGLNYNLRSEAEQPVACEKIGENHIINLEHDKFPHDSITVRQCDTITIVNLDHAFYKITFGIHDSHIDYPGYTPLVMSKHDSIKIDAVQPGTFNLHDHLRNHAYTQLTVTPLENK